jgi:hypothetical protein
MFYKSPLAQNLYLLTHSERFRNVLEKIKATHQQELSLIRKNRQSSALATHEVGSDKLKTDIENAIQKCPLYKRPELHVLRALTVFLLTGIDIAPLLREAERDKEINTLIPPPWVYVDSGEEGTAIAISISPYHTQNDVIKAVKKNWEKIDQAREQFKSKKLQMDKFQPFTDFERDIELLKDKESGIKYKDLCDKYHLSEDGVKQVVKRIRKRISALYL